MCGFRTEEHCSTGKHGRGSIMLRGMYVYSDFDSEWIKERSNFCTYFLFLLKLVY